MLVVKRKTETEGGDAKAPFSYTDIWQHYSYMCTIQLLHSLVVILFIKLSFPSVIKTGYISL